VIRNHVQYVHVGMSWCWAYVSHFFAWLVQRMFSEEAAFSSREQVWLSNVLDLTQEVLVCKSK
jgi:hypothetical protein